jgi:hypothetical protein
MIVLASQSKQKEASQNTKRASLALATAHWSTIAYIRCVLDTKHRAEGLVNPKGLAQNKGYLFWIAQSM